MKKLESGQMELVNGGGRCEATVGVIGGTGLAMLPFLFSNPLTFAVGVVAVGVAVLGSYGCPWK